MMTAFGRWVHRSRVERGWSIERLAACAKISAGTLVLLEAGGADHVDPHTLRGLARALGVHPVTLLLKAGYVTAGQVASYRPAPPSRLRRAVA